MGRLMMDRIVVDQRERGETNTVSIHLAILNRYRSVVRLIYCTRKHWLARAQIKWVLLVVRSFLFFFVLFFFFLY